MRKFFVLLEIIFCSHYCFAFETDSLPQDKKRLNVVLSNRASRPDPAMMSFHSQAWWNQLFHKKKFRFIIAETLDEAVDRIRDIMEKEKSLIGNLWFDSHGHMARRVSLFELGDVELNYQTIKEPWINEKLSLIGKYCDSNTTIVLGSCYSAASYYSAGTDRFPPQRMNGDILMNQIAEIMNHATVYGSVSWVATKPGLFRAGYATACSPLARRLKDPKFRHAWDSVGIWKAYKIGEGFRYVNTVSLDHNANLHIAEKAYLDFQRNKKKKYQRSKCLKEGNYRDKYFFRYKAPLHIKNGKEIASK